MAHLLGPGQSCAALTARPTYTHLARVDRTCTAASASAVEEQRDLHQTSLYCALYTHNALEGASPQFLASTHVFRRSEAATSRALPPGLLMTRDTRAKCSCLSGQLKACECVQPSPPKGTCQSPLASSNLEAKGISSLMLTRTTKGKLPVAANPQDPKCQRRHEVLFLRSQGACRGSTPGP